MKCWQETTQKGFSLQIILKTIQFWLQTQEPYFRMNSIPCQQVPHLKSEVFFHKLLGCWLLALWLQGFALISGGATFPQCIPCLGMHLGCRTPLAPQPHFALAGTFLLSLFVAWVLLLSACPNHLSVPNCISKLPLKNCVISYWTKLPQLDRVHHPGFCFPVP